MESDSSHHTPGQCQLYCRRRPRNALLALIILISSVWLFGSGACTPMCPTYSHSLSLQPSRKKTNVNQNYRDWDERKYMGKKSKVRPN